jgi:transcription elongation factor Elf1
VEPKESIRTLPFTCPVCGKRTDRSVDELKEGALLICPFCHLKLTLHGHMWEEIREGIKGLDS